MPRILHTRGVVSLKRGRGIDGNRLAMCDIVMKEDEQEPEEKKEQMNELIGKLSKIKIINPSNSAKAKKEIKNKFISI